MAVKCPTCHSDNPETLQTPARELATGSIFAGRYQVIDELGHGGMGRVYRALDKETVERFSMTGKRSAGM